MHTRFEGRFNLSRAEKYAATNGEHHQESRERGSDRHGNALSDLSIYVSVAKGARKSGEKRDKSVWDDKVAAGVAERRSES